MARRSKQVTKAPPFEHAKHQIATMERAVVYRTVTTGFTAMDVARWLWPADVVDKLTAAYPYVRDVDRCNYDGTHEWDDTIFRVNLSTKLIGMLAPAHHLDPERNAGSYPRPMGRSNPVIEATFRQVEGIVEKFWGVRRVVDWLNEHATYGAARYYFPGILSLVPSDHPVHAVAGNSFKETKRPISEIANDMREACTTVAMGLLSDPDHVETPASQFGLSIGSSQTFWLA